MNDNDTATFSYIESLTTEQALTCGAVLTLAREAAGLTQRELAEQLHLLPAIVRALEANDFSAIRSPLYCRGYLISYAKHFKLDVAELLALYEQQCPKPKSENHVVVKPPMHTTFKPVAIPFSAVARRTTYGKSIAACGLVSLVVALLFVANNTSINSRIESQQSPTTVPVSASQIHARQMQEPTAQTKSAQNVSVPAVASKSVELPGSNPLQIEDSRADQKMAVNEPVKVEATVNAKANRSVDGSDTLSLRFTENCWIEIRDGNNVVIASGTYRANDALNVSGKGPFKLHLGFAPGVNVALNGQAIDVGQGDAVNHTARLVVGSS
jgi:cytoskeleton protein RodZ